ncbi:hypothetical protein [Rhodococcoides corynebacterioides]|uniref:hypothetical protein n=1 Tax=Rhodococcoides corynebacterioides TaxID=53972 RepID=UPI001C9B2312|nr:hypothetical protein [Rhodococcus corynebacterioides]MBY6362475.1 hypothetical protein [Rhodococcus corynebacterioides]
MEAGDLESMPAGRAVLRAAKCPPVLLETLPWYAGPLASVAAAKLRAGQDPTVARCGDDPDPGDTSSLLPVPASAAEHPPLKAGV